MILLNYLDINGKLYYASAEGFTADKVQLKTSEDFISDNSKEEGNLEEHQVLSILGLFNILPVFYDSEISKAKLKFEKFSKEKKDDFLHQKNIRGKMFFVILALHLEHGNDIKKTIGRLKDEVK